MERFFLATTGMAAPFFDSIPLKLYGNLPPKIQCPFLSFHSALGLGAAGGPGPREVNCATKGGCPGSLALGDPGDHESQPDVSRIWLRASNRQLVAYAPFGLPEDPGEVPAMNWRSVFNPRNECEFARPKPQPSWPAPPANKAPAPPPPKPPCPSPASAKIPSCSPSRPAAPAKP